MRKTLAYAVAQMALMAVFCHGQVSGTPEPPKDPREFVKSAAQYYDFSSADLKPWHLKASYQFYSPDGKPTEQGTWEYWWTSPTTYHSSWMRKDVSFSVWNTKDGIFRKQSGKPLKLLEKQIEQITVSPVPFEQFLNAEETNLALKTISIGNVQLDCISATSVKAVKRPPYSSVEMPPSFLIHELYGDDCFDPSLHALRVIHKGFITYEFNQLAKSQGRYFPKQAAVISGGHKLLSISLETLDGISPQDESLTPPTDAVLLIKESKDPANKTAGPVIHLTKMEGGLITKTVAPIYPPISTIRGEQGTVILDITVGTDGKVYDMDPLAWPSPPLLYAAEEAVKRWEFQPFLLNGVPVEMRTSASVTFAPRK